MHLDRRLLGWGVFFILLGVVPLAVRANALDREVVSRWPTLWPVLLIGWGLGLVLRRTPVEWLGGAVTAVTIGLMGGGAIATGFGGIPSFSGCGGTGGTAFQAQQGGLNGSGQIEVEFNCGSLAVTTGDGPGWLLTGTDQDGRGPLVDTEATGRVTLKSQVRGFPFGGGRSTWNVTLPRTSRLEAGFTLNAGDGSIDLGGATLGALNVTINAGSMAIDLRGAKDLPRDGLNATVNAGKATLLLPSFDGTVNLSLNAGNLTVCVPEGTPLEVHWSGTIASSNLDSSGLVKVGDSTWRSVGLDPTTAHVELDVSANAGSFDLQPGGSCDA